LIISQFVNNLFRIRAEAKIKRLSLAVRVVRRNEIVHHQEKKKNRVGFLELKYEYGVRAQEGRRDTWISKHKKKGERSIIRDEWGEKKKGKGWVLYGAAMNHDLLDAEKKIKVGRSKGKGLKGELVRTLRLAVGKKYNV